MPVKAGEVAASLVAVPLVGNVRACAVGDQVELTLAVRLSPRSALLLSDLIVFALRDLEEAEKMRRDCLHIAQPSAVEGEVAVVADPELTRGGLASSG